MRKTYPYHVAENLVEPKDRGTAGGEPLVEYDKEDRKISFLRPKKLFKELRADESTMKAIRERRYLCNRNNDSLGLYLQSTLFLHISEEETYHQARETMPIQDCSEW
jgi:hypothetical protein